MKPLVPVVLGALLACACSKKTALDKKQGAPPPPPPSAVIGACRGGGGKVNDSATAAFFPRKVAGYCIDPNGETRAYGKESKNPIDQVCLEQFNGECEVYKGYGLDRVVTLRYIDGEGTTGEVSMTLARFETKDGSYGFFTRRVIADQDPAESKTKPLAAGGEGAIGTGIAYIWRGLYVVQLAYTNTEESPDDLAKTSAKVLPPIAKAIGEGLAGEKDPPRAVRLLPSEKRLPLGIAYEFGDVLGVKGAGMGAIGHYVDGKRRWQALAIVRPDADGAEDIMETFEKLDGAKDIEGLPFEAVRFTLKSDEESPPAQWIVARRAERVVGIGDEAFALTADTGPEQLKKLTLNEQQKLELLQQLLKASGESPTDIPTAAPSASP